MKRYYLASKEYLLFCSIYFVLAFINLRIKIGFTLDWNDGGLLKQHTQLMDFIYRNHEQSRLLQFYIPEFFSQIFSLSIPHAYSLRRLVFVFLSLACFHLYLKKWFDTKTVFSGVVFLAAIMPLTYRDHLQESAPLLMFLFLLGLWAIREYKDKTLMLILFVGALNNETILILPLVYFLYYFKVDLLKNQYQAILLLIGRTIVIALPAFIVSTIVRYSTKDNGGYGSKVWHLDDNIEGIFNALMNNPLDYIYQYYLFFIFIFGIFWLIAWLPYARLPLFLQRASWIIPVFVLIHLLTGIIAESRQMIPMAFLIIPMGLFYLFPEENKH